MPRLPVRRPRCASCKGKGGTVERTVLPDKVLTVWHPCKVCKGTGRL